MKKFLVTGALAASLVSGSIALSAMGPFGVASAQDDSSTTTEAPAETDAATPSLPGGLDGRGAMVSEALANLVSDGTLTQDQADAVTAELQELGAARQADHEARRAETQQNLADLLGITVDELEAAREDGQTIADLAGDDVDAVIDAIVAQRIARADEALAAGDITQERYDDMTANVEDRVTAFVNGEGPMGGRGGRLGRGGFVAPDGAALADATAGATTDA